jgi:hypothetical protein
LGSDSHDYADAELLLAKLKRWTSPAPDVVTELQHCQFARHAQEPAPTQLGIHFSVPGAAADGEIGEINFANKKAGARSAGSGSNETSRRKWRRERLLDYFCAFA